MQFRRLLFITLLTSFMSHSLPAQVQSKSFGWVLKTMLSDKVPAISVAEAAKNSNRYTFLDAREAEEYKVSHLPDAVFIGYNNFRLTSINNLLKNKPLVVYCAVGKRSENITKKLKAAGFTHVYNLYGGIFEWVNQGHTVVDAHNHPTTKVHAYNRLWGQWLEKGEKAY